MTNLPESIDGGNKMESLSYILTAGSVAEIHAFCQMHNVGMEINNGKITRITPYGYARKIVNPQHALSFRRGRKKLLHPKYFKTCKECEEPFKTDRKYAKLCGKCRGGHYEKC